MVINYKSDPSIPVVDLLAKYEYKDGSGRIGLVRVNSDKYQELVNNPNIEVTMQNIKHKKWVTLKG